MLGSGKHYIALAAVVWIVACVAGAGVMMRYAITPGTTGALAATWPAGTTLSRNGNGNTLMLFAHPRCPCTKATLGEMREVLAAHGASLNVIFFEPEGADAEWKESSLVRAAKDIKGATVAYDPAGLEARRFGVETSGHVLLFNQSGNLLFSGGITRARGERGENAARESFTAQLQSQGSAIKTAPVFGCELFAPGTCPSESSSCCRS